jgi:hypothetical protein
MARGHPRVYILLNGMNMLVNVFHKSVTNTHFHRENIYNDEQSNRLCDGHTQALTGQGVAFLLRSKTERLDNCETNHLHMDSQDKATSSFNEPTAHSLD